MLGRAERFFAHDTFWLNPLARLFDRGAVREVVREPSTMPALLVRYGADSPLHGDAYLFMIGSDHLPTAWKLWTSTLPFGGVRASVGRWQTLSTGARVATLHRMQARWVSLSELAGATALTELEPGEDPFAALSR